MSEEIEVLQPQDRPLWNNWIGTFKMILNFMQSPDADKWMQFSNSDLKVIIINRGATPRLVFRKDHKVVYLAVLNLRNFAGGIRRKSVDGITLDAEEVESIKEVTHAVYFIYYFELVKLSQPTLGSNRSLV